MDPVRFRISYELEGGSACTIARDGFDDFACSDFELRFEREGEALQVRIVPAVRLRLDSFELEFAHDCTNAQILMNGYQSWTSTYEMPITARMASLDNVPGPIVRRYVLDGGGDYRFTQYSNEPGYFHGWTYATFRVGERVTLLGSLDETRGFTLIRTHGAENRVTVHPEVPAHALDAHRETLLASLFVAEGARDDVYTRWFAAMGIAPRTARPLTGYSSWYRHYDSIDHSVLLDDLAGALKAFSSQEIAPVVGDAEAAGTPFVRLFQVDDGWCTVGDWLQPDFARFPEGMGELAVDIRAAGFLPGLWMAPFVCSQSSDLMKQRPEWLLRDESGLPVATGSHWGGAFALDTRNPDVRAYVTQAIRHAVEEWGYGLLKLDFLYAACLVVRDGMNRGELMADAMGLVREAAGDALILACGVPLASAFGKAEYCRVGCDVGLDWDDAPPMRLLHRERVSTRLALLDSESRAPLDGRAFGVDPDVVFLRNDVRLTQAQKTRMYDIASTCGSVVLTSDDMGAWDFVQRSRFAQILERIIEKRG